MKKNQITTKKELGSFCEQFGYQSLKSPSRKKPKHHKKYSKYYKKSQTNQNIQETMLNEQFIGFITRVTYQKWKTLITLAISASYTIQIVALIDTGADMNCIQQGIIPTKYCEKSKEKSLGTKSNLSEPNYN